MDHVQNLNEYLVAVSRRLGENTPVAVLPDGPLTIPEMETQVHAA